MTELDEAIKLGFEDPKKQHLFYDLFLNSIFYIPVIEEEEEAQNEEGALPLLVEANDKTYLMLFDTIKKLTDWADGEAKYLPVQGHAITELSSSNIYWALNYGTELQKFFDPEEIVWLKDIVLQTKEKNEK
ncbi:MAG: SseB family protein [Desulfuromusa sp.]|nr:SseB family protein [Desulfuromusa sp.]